MASSSLPPNGQLPTNGQLPPNGPLPPHGPLLPSGSLPADGSRQQIGPPQQIGTVARRSGLPVKTIRFYCDQGLIQPRGRTAGGYRLFDERVYAELALLRTLRSLDLPLETIRRILQARREGVCTCEALQGTIRSKAAEISGQIEALQQLRRELDGLLQHWQPCGGRPLPG
jgi:DNA-binding transcriptional MerR regulator